MKTKITKTERLFNRIMASSVFRRNGRKIDLCAALIDLCDAINAEDETDWSMGECHECSLSDLLPGAYWALTEWHGGQWSPEYRALSAIGGIFSPGMSSPPEEDEGGGERIAYEQVSAYFERQQKARAA